jgi:flagellar protein FliO/FliZ
VILDTLFGEGQTGPKILLFLVVVLGLLALAFWLLRRFGGGRLGGASTRGRQPRLAMIDQAAIDNRRRLVLIRRDNVEHLLIIGGPTDVVIEQNIVRAAGAPLAPGRPAAATDTLPRAVPLGEDTTWPLQPEPAPKPEGAPRVEPMLRAEPPPRSQRPPTSVEESIHWPGEAEPPAAPLPAPSPAAPRDRKPFAVDPLAGLAEELSRIPPAPTPGGLEPRQAPRRAPRPSLPASPAAPTADAPLTPASDQNLSEMAQRLEAALRRPKSGEKSGGKPSDSAQPVPRPEPAGPALEDFAPPPASRLGAALRRPFSTDDVRASQFAPKTAGEAAATDMDEFAPAPSGPRFDTIPRRPLQADEARPTPAPATNEMPEAAPPEHTPESTDVADGKPTPPKSLYDSLEQEMASLLNRPPSKP